MTDFEMFIGNDGRLFLHIHTPETTYIVAVTREEIDDLHEQLEKRATPVPEDIDTDDSEDTDE